MNKSANGRWMASLSMAVGFQAAITPPDVSAQPVSQILASQPTPVSEQAQREYVLEIMGLGVTLDRYRQGNLWESLQQGSPYASIREQDPKKYPWGAQDKEGLEGQRSGDSLENGAYYTPVY